MAMLRKIGRRKDIKGPDCDWRRGGARRFPVPRDRVSLQDTDRSIDARQWLVERMIGFRDCKSHSTLKIVLHHPTLVLFLL